MITANGGKIKSLELKTIVVPDKKTIRRFEVYIANYNDANIHGFAAFDENDEEIFSCVACEDYKVVS